MRLLSTIAGTVTAIYVAGLVLNEAGSGRFGDTAKDLAQKITKGYGV
jgi:hypothetical protein